jgi:tetratricopeptide (TPR) repeat protein
VFRLIPDDLESTFEYAGALLLSGDTKGYKRVCAYLLERGDKLKCLNHPGRKSYLLARTCLLSPASGADLAKLSRLAGRAVRAEPRGPWNLHTLGLAHYRAGRYEEAVKRLNEPMQVYPGWPAQPVNWLTLAMAHHHLGHAAEARQWLDNAVRAIDLNRRDNPRARTALGMHPHDWVACLLLRREAEALIPGAGK